MTALSYTRAVRQGGAMARHLASVRFDAGRSIAAQLFYSNSPNLHNFGPVAPCLGRPSTVTAHG